MLWQHVVLCKSYATESAPGCVCRVVCSLKFYVCALVGVLIKTIHNGLINEKTICNYVKRRSVFLVRLFWFEIRNTTPALALYVHVRGSGERGQWIIDRRQLGGRVRWGGQDVCCEHTVVAVGPVAGESLR